MNKARRCSNRGTLLLAAGFLFLMLSGCGSDGSDGAPGPQGPAGDPGGPGPSIGPVTSLTMTGDSASVGISPVINFTVRNQNGQGYAGLVPNDLRFTVAKLVPAAGAGMPSNWQNYIVTTQTSSAAGAPGAGRVMVQGTRETPAGSADPSAGPPFPPGTLVNYADGRYTYTFATDITNVACPAPCRDAWGRPLDLSFNASLTHRIGVQTRGGNAPMVNLAYDFVPAGGAVTTQREIVKTAKCNECHNKLELHDERIETRYCVTCHNRGSTDPDGERPAKDAPAMQPAYVLASGAVDFKQMIHKIHRGEDLPSVGGCNDPPRCVVPGGEEYAIWGYLNSKHDYSTVVFPQDIRNCTKCHDGADPDTPQGNNWNNVPSIEACGACHDQVIFDAPLGTTNGHPGGPVNLSTNCTNCHATGLIGKSPAEAHVIPGRAEAANYEFVIDAIRGDGLMTAPFLEIDVSVKNPNTGALYDIASGDATTNPVFKASNARLALDLGWSLFASGANVDYNNVGSVPAGPASYTVSSAPTPAQPLGVNPVGECEFHLFALGSDPSTDWVCSDPEGDFIYTLTKQSALPAGAVGTGRVAFEGHPALPDNSGRMVIRSKVLDFAITDMTPIARRDIVDINKCKQCHDVLALHGANRVDEPQLCVMCHNPSLTDISYNNNSNFACAGPAFPDNRARPKVTTTGDITGNVLYPLTSCLDGLTEQNAQFKVLIHGIHAADRDEHGFRENGIQVRRDDFSHVRFPGILSDCETCHLPGTYELEGAWEAPTLNGIQAASIATTPGVDSSNVDPNAYGATLNDQADDLRISPTAAACAACHDGAVAQSHMTALGGATFGATQAAIDMTVESCSVCHGPGHLADVEVVHERE